MLSISVYGFPISFPTRSAVYIDMVTILSIIYGVIPTPPVLSILTEHQVWIQVVPISSLLAYEIDVTLLEAM